MKINLKSQDNKKNISSVRSQITDSAFLKDFDKFIATHDAFDFKNDEHLKALKKIEFDSDCTIHAEL